MHFILLDVGCVFVYKVAISYDYLFLQLQYASPRCTGKNARI